MEPFGVISITNNLYKLASLIDDPSPKANDFSFCMEIDYIIASAQANVVWRIPSDYQYMYLAFLIGDLFIFNYRKTCV